MISLQGHRGVSSGLGYLKQAPSSFRGLPVRCHSRVTQEFISNVFSQSQWSPFQCTNLEGISGGNFLTCCFYSSNSDSSEDRPEAETSQQPAEQGSTPTENFSFPAAADKGGEENESSSLTIRHWRKQKQENDFCFSQPEAGAGFSSHPSRPSSPLSRTQEEQALITSEERERGQSPFSRQRQQEEELLEHLAHSRVPKRSWWNRLLCFCRGPKPEEGAGNEGNGQETRSGDNDPGEGE